MAASLIGYSSGLVAEDGSTEISITQPSLVVASESKKLHARWRRKDVQSAFSQDPAFNVNGTEWEDSDEIDFAVDYSASLHVPSASLSEDEDNDDSEEDDNDDDGDLEGGDKHDYR